jgi:hypothetical protein
MQSQASADRMGWMDGRIEIYVISNEHRHR